MSTKLTIDRERWLRGEGSGLSYLLRPSDEKMCCLGFYGLACGFQPESLADTQTPTRVTGWPTEATWLLSSFCPHHVSIDCAELMARNDDRFTNESMREDRIAAIFARHGVEVEFVN